MRSDTNLNKRFTAEGIDTRQYGSMPGVLDTNTKVEGKRVLRSHSFSGKENNSLFHNRDGQRFDDISGISGLDSVADGRAFAYFDYDHDGKTDVVMTNSNNPQLQLFHNDIATTGNVVKVRLIGGNQTSAFSEEWSSRDGYGAHVIMEFDGNKLRRELRCGDGFAAQNSRTLTIGIGASKQVDKLSVEWPSGKRSDLGTVAAGSLATIYENPTEAQSKAPKLSAAELPKAAGTRPVIAKLDLRTDADLAAVVTMATWCPICLQEIPHLARLANATRGGIRFYGLPIDPEDNSDKLLKYEKENAPPYEILAVTPDQRDAVRNLMNKKFADQPLPTTLIMDRAGNVLQLQKGLPTLSQLRMLVP